eukprot:NODE_452_length_8270_cov_0.487823.p1 type:complete len:465 gc:universal NODE_452_length_8270_cov_0.487823:4444-3050(-)
MHLVALNLIAAMYVKSTAPSNTIAGFVNPTNPFAELNQVNTRKVIIPSATSSVHLGKSKQSNRNTELIQNVDLRYDTSLNMACGFVEFVRFATNGKIGEFEIEELRNTRDHASDMETLSFADLGDFSKNARKGNMEMEKYLEHINSPSIIGKLTTEESFTEFLATNLAYVDVEPGMVIQCNVDSSSITDSKIVGYASKYIVTRLMRHDHAGFFSFILEPFLPRERAYYKTFVVTRGTALSMTKKETVRGSCNGALPLDLDKDGVAYNFMHWQKFKKNAYEFLHNLDNRIVVFTGHSLGGVVSHRLLDFAGEALPALFKDSYSYGFNAPKIDMASVPHLALNKHKVINYINRGDLVSNYPFHRRHEFLTFIRNIKSVKFQWTNRLYFNHVFTPLTHSALSGEVFNNFEILNNDGDTLDRMKEQIKNADLNGIFLNSIIPTMGAAPVAKPRLSFLSRKNRYQVDVK